MNDLSAALPETARATLPPITLVLGGARSGKSVHAEGLVEAAADPATGAVYIATAEAWDDEMRARIAEHRARRGPLWRTVDAPRDLAAALDGVPDAIVLVDCLTLWTSNHLLAESDLEAEADALLAALARHAGPVVLVANEVGLGIVPDNALARAFRDAAGRLNQRVAALASRVVFLAAGLPIILKS